MISISFFFIYSAAVSVVFSVFRFSLKFFVENLSKSHLYSVVIYIYEMTRS